MTGSTTSFETPYISLIVLWRDIKQTFVPAPYSPALCPIRSSPEHAGVSAQCLPAPCYAVSALSDSRFHILGYATSSIHSFRPDICVHICQRGIHHGAIGESVVWLYRQCCHPLNNSATLRIRASSSAGWVQIPIPEWSTSTPLFQSVVGKNPSRCC